MNILARTNTLRGPFTMPKSRQLELPPGGLIINNQRKDLGTQVSNLSVNSNYSLVEVSPLLRLTVLIPKNGIVRIRAAMVTSSSSSTTNFYLGTNIFFGPPSPGSQYLTGMRFSQSGAGQSCNGEYTWTGLPPGLCTFSLYWASSTGDTVTLSGNTADCFGSWHQATTYSLNQ